VQAYQSRFRQTWGFYEGRAAVEGNDGWFHILPDGSPLNGQRFDWCGNFQEGRCAVRFSDGTYGHIGIDGSTSYEARHLYAGDYREGIAVVRYSDSGLCGHIDATGDPVHADRYLDLDMFHKGYARARDERGWFHVRLDGTPAYDRRLAAVEPFYNGQALGENLAGERIIISSTGMVVHTVGAPVQGGTARHILFVGNIGAGKTTAATATSEELDWPLISLDNARRACSDGSAAGEAAAWAYFIQLVSSQKDSVIEFSGSGPIASLVGHSLRDANADVLVMWLTASEGTCLRRTRSRGLDAPYPDFGVPVEQVIHDLQRRLDREIGSALRWSGLQVHEIDAEQEETEVRAAIQQIVRAWHSERDGHR